MLYAFVKNVLSLDILIKNKVPRKRIKRKNVSWRRLTKVSYPLYFAGEASLWVLLKSSVTCTYKLTAIDMYGSKHH